MKINEEAVKEAISSMEKMWAENARTQAIRAVENCAIGNTVSLASMLIIVGPYCLTTDYIEFPKRPEMPSFEKWTAEGTVDFEPMPTAVFHVEKYFRQPPGFFRPPEHVATLWRRVR